MAHVRRLGGLLKGSVSLHGTSNDLVPMSSMFNAIRYMSSKLFVGGLSWGTDDQSLRDAFSSYGSVTEARVINDRDTGRSRGFGFVNFETDESASSALSSMDGQELHGRNIRVSYANERPTGGFRSGGGFGGGYQGEGGGYSGGRNDDDLGAGSGRGF